ncbi:exo-beta-N-acetylmuramidase NamZ domain-containing protein [Pseudoalteromonas mariniglutinosa]|uniref:exo-beta-N-acetylmuramidase NamZ family protein n=1 Tax=Pseudoalteromonas mariniglutinosa TaxID=206042 RepID=UPI00384C3BF2
MRVLWCVLIQCLFLTACSEQSAQQVDTNKAQVQVGATDYTAYLPMLTGKRVGLVVNQTSQVNGQHIVDLLRERNVNVSKIFAPEHGFRGDHDAGAHVKSSVDEKTGIDVVSIYGSNKKPSNDVLQSLDVIIFDIQDVGVRFYTYISSMHYMMEAAAENNIEFIVLDRPNPNIAYVDGPILDPQFRSFVGMHEIPVLHGMTVGELAQMIKGEGWIKQAAALDLTVIPVKNYDRTTAYNLPIQPSPNLPNAQSIQLYPSLCFFEATPITIGRGTDFPFQVVGYSPVALGEFNFTPRAIKGASMTPKFKGVEVFGQDLRSATIHGLDLTLFIETYKILTQANETFFERADFMDKLAGTDKLRLAIMEGQSAEQIKHSWQSGLNHFKQQRQPYLLYK